EFRQYRLALGEQGGRLVGSLAHGPEICLDDANAVEREEVEPNAIRFRIGKLQRRASVVDVVGRKLDPRGRLGTNGIVSDSSDDSEGGGRVKARISVAAADKGRGHVVDRPVHQDSVYSPEFRRRRESELGGRPRQKLGPKSGHRA